MGKNGDSSRKSIKKSFLSDKKSLPREKMLKYGVKSLENWELLAIVLGQGVRGADVFAISKELDQILRSARGFPSLQELCSVSGIGPSKATQLLACLEVSQRCMLGHDRFRIRESSDIAALFADLRDAVQEHFYCITLNAAHEVLGRHLLTVGLVDQTQIHPREAFRHAIADSAVAVAFVHNHPGGSAEPSAQDYAITRRLREAGELLGMRVLDHIIVARKGWSSAM